MKADISESKIRVLLVTTSFPLSEDSVSGIFVKRLADALSDLSDLQVLVPAGRRPAETGHHPYSVHVFRYGLRSWHRLSHEPGGIPAALKEKKALWLAVPALLAGLFFAVWRQSHDIDVIHANWSAPGLVCALIGRLKGIPTITTLRGSDVSNTERSIHSSHTLLWLLKLGSHISTVSSAMYEKLKLAHPAYAHRMEHISNGVDASFLEIEPPERTGPIRLIAIGNLIKEKGFQDTLMALAAASRSISLTIVGEGPYRAELESISLKLRLDEQVTFVGARNPIEIPALLAEHDCLIMSSYSEGRPNVVIEAMAAARAVIATSLPGVVELVEHDFSGIIFNPKDIHALRDAILKLQNHPDINIQLGHNARKTILARQMTWQHCARKYQFMYQKICKSTQRCAD